MSKCEHCGAHDHEEKEENLKAEVVKLVIALIIFATAFFKVVPGKIATWLFVAAYILSGYEVLLKSIKNIFRGEVFDENFLMSIATLGAFAINKPGEAAAVMIFYNVGELFEDYAVGKSKKSIIQLINIKNKHYFYHGAIITERNVPSSVSLGMFVFTTTNPMKDKRTKNKIPDEELSKRLLVHEYGHTIQSLIFGPFYLIVMGIPSTLWGFLPYFQNKRNNGVSYFSFFIRKTN